MATLAPLPPPEIWDYVPGYGGRYFVSNYGRVRSNHTGELLAYQLNGALGRGKYPIVHLYDSTRRRVALIHRLVASVFVPNPENKPEVNHIDGNRLNNQASNLEWVSRQENVTHAKNTGLLRPARRAVVGVSVADGREVRFASQRDAELALSGTGKQSSAINHCLSGKKKSAYGYVWRRANVVV